MQQTCQSPFLAFGTALAIAGSMSVDAHAQSAAGLIGLWHLDGDATDSSGNGHHGTIVGATSVAGGVSGAAAFSFDGNDRINVGNLDFSGGKYTVNIWLQTTRPAVTEDWRMAINKADTSFVGDQTFEILLGDGRPPPTEGQNGPMIQVWDGGAGVVNESVGFNSNINARDGNWHMVTMTYTTGAQKMYVNGCLAATAKYAGPLPLVSQEVAIGGVDGFGPYHHPWIGNLDEVSIYSRVLPGPEVLDLYKLFRPSGGCGAVSTEFRLREGICRNVTAAGSVTALVSRQYWNCAGLEAEVGDSVATEIQGTAK